MALELLIPAALGPAFATGEVTLMTTAAGATTTLVSTSGTVVGTATLVPAAGATVGGVTVTAAGGGAAGATFAAGAATLVLPIALAVGAAALVGGGCYVVYRRRHTKKGQGSPVVPVGENRAPEDALRAAEEIVDSEYERLLNDVNVLTVSVGQVD